MFRFRRKVTGGEQVPSLIPKTYLDVMSKKMIENNEIDSELYSKYNVKRGLRNANGTGVVVGLTRIGEVIGYETDENRNKIPVEGQLYYRGYEIQDLVQSYVSEERFGFEEVTYLLLFGDLPTQKQLNEFKRLIGEKRNLPAGFARDMILLPLSTVLVHNECALLQ